MIDRNEELLDAWLRLSTVVINDRLTSEMPYNEALICNILYRRQLHTPDALVTATDLCRITKMLKSQMNRTLQSMESKGLITRTRSEIDRRQVYIRLISDCPLYQKQHQKILSLIDSLIHKLGPEKTDEIIFAFTKVADTAEEVL